MESQLSPEQKEMARRYMELKTIIANAKDEFDEIKDSVTTSIFEAMGEKASVKGDLGSLTMSMKKNWKYPQVITDFEARIKVLREHAEASGEAKFSKYPSLTFRRAKTGGIEV
jgi:hypothetical protein